MNVSSHKFIQILIGCIATVALVVAVAGCTAQASDMYRNINVYDYIGEWEASTIDGNMNDDTTKTIEFSNSVYSMYDDVATYVKFNEDNTCEVVTGQYYVKYNSTWTEFQDEYGKGFTVAQTSSDFVGENMNFPEMKFYCDEETNTIQQKKENGQLTINFEKYDAENSSLV